MYYNYLEMLLARAQAGKNQGEERRARQLGRRLERRCWQARLTKEQRGGRGGLGRRCRKVMTRASTGSEAKSVQHIRYSHASVVNCIIRQSPRPLILIIVTFLNIVPYMRNIPFNLVHYYQ